MSGDFVWTLTVTDELTSRTQNRARGNKGQDATCQALHHILREAPFRVRSINTDNGSEFTNYHLQHFLKEHYKSCEMTRSRPNRKNDNARVEERNLHVVRECAGYERLMEQLKEGKRKRRLKAQHEALNPWELREKIQGAVKEILLLQERLEQWGGRPTALERLAKGKKTE